MEIRRIVIWQIHGDDYEESADFWHESLSIIGGKVNHFYHTPQPVWKKTLSLPKCKTRKYEQSALANKRKTT